MREAVVSDDSTVIPVASPQPIGGAGLTCTRDVTSVEPAGPDLVLPGRAAALDLHRTPTPHGGSFGTGCASLLDVALHVAAGCPCVRLVDGGRVRFVRSRSGLVSTAGPIYALVEHADGWSLSTWQRTVIEFGADGLAHRWRTDAGEVDAVRDGRGQIVVVEERSCGHRLHIDWADGVVAQLTTDDGQAASYTYRSGRLVRVTRRRAW